MNEGRFPETGPELEPERYEIHASPGGLTELARREFRRVLGGGLVVLGLWRDAGAQESGGRRRRGRLAGAGGAPRRVPGPRSS